MSEQRPPVPQDLLQLHPVGEPRFSPDGRTIAYVVQEFDRQQDTVISDIWVVRVPDGSPHRITSGAGRKFSPRWSPDGSKVAFLSDDQEKPGIWLVPAGGGEAQRIATPQQPTGGLSWSPDGRCLAYAARVFSYADSWAPYPGAPENDAARARGQARGDDSAGDVKVISRLDHKLDGVGYFGDAHTQLFVVAADTGATSRQVTNGPYDHTDPAWSPNGDALVCVARRETEAPGRDNLWGAKDLWRVKTDGSNLTRLFAGHGPIQAPSFSPDGQAIAFFGHGAEFGPASFPQLWLFQCNTGKATCLTDSLDRFVGTPAYADSRYNFGMSPLTPLWSADGSELYFLAGMGGDAHLLAVAAANGTIRQISPGEGRSIADVTVNSNGGAAYVRGDSGTLDEIYYLDPDRADEHQVTAHNATTAIAVGFRKGERVEFSGADGWPIEGWLYTPPGRAGGERVPLVLIVHGGPHLCFGEILSMEVQGLLGAGMAVMTVNPRGSGGYSQAFSAACLQDWGGKDREDLMAGVDYAIARGVADPERLGIMGWSYGGFMSSWTITQTDRFKAALIGACVSNRLSFAGTSDIPWFMTHSAGGDSWEPAGVEKLLERSAIRYVKNISTPALIVHPEGDLRCPVEQGEQLFTNLRRLGKEAYLVKYPGEFHIMLKPSHRLDYFERIVSWFRHRL